MERLEHPSFKPGFEQWPDTKWTAEDKPILIVDGVLHPVKSLSQTISGQTGYVVGAGDRELPKLAEFLEVTFLHFYELRAADLSPLSEIQQLRNLKIDWNTKVDTLDAIGQLGNLESLALVNTPKIRDLSPLEALSKLVALEYSGGVWTPNRAVSLAPIASLPKLEELALWNLRVESGGLRSLGQCRSLKTLAVSNQFDTEDYAYLSVALPQVKCDYFAPWVRVDMGDGRDTCITGRRKPFLNSKVHTAKIAAHEEAFKQLQKRFASDLSL
jgi:hypothetical protein